MDKAGDIRSTNKILYKEESFAIQGAVFEVYRQMGNGFLESIYQECLEIEFQERKIPFIAHPKLQLSYKGTPLQQSYIPDLVCYDKIIIELKAAKKIAAEHKAQAINYLKAADMNLALLINFGSYPKAVVTRIVL